MSLTRDEIAVIEQEATRLEKWADNVSFSYSPTVVRFSPSFGTEQMILSLLKEMPAVGAKIQKDYKVLDQVFADACKQFRKPMTTEGDEEERQILTNTARGCARQIAGELRHITRMAESEKPVETRQKNGGSKIMITTRTSNENWEAIRCEYDISKKDFGKKINFVSDSFKRKIIFRDVEHAFVLASQGFSKPAVILAGGVIEELLRLYLEDKNIKLKNKRFVDYITACEDNSLLKRGVYRLSDSVRNFRNLVHLENEKTRRDTVSKATAKGAVSSIFTIANDFQ